FIHMWRVETTASVVLLSTLVWFALRLKHKQTVIAIPAEEWWLIILPIAAFILWGGVSAFWAESWKSAIHHSLIWTEYLIFYVIFRRMLERGHNLAALLSVFIFTLILYSLPAISEFCAYLWFGGGTTIGVRFAKYGEQIVTVLPIVLLAVLRMRGKQFAAGVLGVTLMWLLVFCSMGRANYMLFGAGVIVMLAVVMIVKRYRRYTPRFAVLILILALAPLPLNLFSVLSADSDVSAVGRFGQTEALANSNNFRKLMMSVAGEMIRANPIAGIGADNFGMQVNRYREVYGAANPHDANLANAEDQIPSHAHNELLQIMAELGVIGLAIISWLLVGISVFAVRALRNLGSGSLYPLAAVLGLGMFLGSSLVSSYSFRVMQNGIVFFFVLAVAAKAGARFRPIKVKPNNVLLSPVQLRFASIAGVIACLGLITYSMIRVTSVLVNTRANQTQAMNDARQLYETAMWLDDENPDARHNFGMRLFRRQRYAEAVPYLEAAVQLGRASSAELSYLATAKTLSGDPSGAETTMKLAADMYPRSPFVLTRYATLIESHGKQAEADIAFDRAIKINRRAATTWRAVIISGPKALSEMAARDESYMHVMELKPESSIYAVVTERYIRHPEEQRFSFVKVVLDEE
ncbi:MAG TPA: O-antigen ligase family protein, partial [Pyrinomonadaceae bacterium]